MDETPGIQTSEVIGVIFCGGLSQRMGQDKALLERNGQTLLQRAHGLLAPHVFEVKLSTGIQPRYESLGLTCVLDKRADLGPIGGLQAALESSQTPWVLAMACDLPGLDATHVQSLMCAPQKGDLAVMFGSVESPEPLFALYHRLLLPRVEQSIRLGQRRMTSFLNASTRSSDAAEPVPVRWLPLPDPRSRAFLNVNRPADWIQFQSGPESDRSHRSPH